MLPNGATVPIEGMGNAVVDRYIGGGTFGDVYAVHVRGQAYALKILKNILKPAEVRQNIRKLIEHGIKHDAFLLPQAMTEGKGDTFGYIMPLRDKRFVELNNILLGQPTVGWRIMAEAAINLVDAFSALHSAGLAYMDLNVGALAIDPRNGDISICDTEGVCANTDNVLRLNGSNMFQPPELVLETAGPSIQTDRHALAVMLFVIFCFNDPLLGKRALGEFMTPELTKELYATNPLFVFDPKDDSNRLHAQKQAQQICRWNALPAYMQEAFVTSFSVGLTSPTSRLAEEAWSYVLTRFRGELGGCPTSGCGWTYPISKWENGYNGTTRCRFCGQVRTAPTLLTVGDYTIVLLPGRKIYKRQVERSTDAKTVVAEVRPAPGEQGMLCITNLSNKTWVVRERGLEKPVPPGHSVRVISGREIDFGQNHVGSIS